MTGSKLGKEYKKFVYHHPVYLSYMLTSSCKMPGWMIHNLESRLPREISTTSYIDWSNSCLESVNKYSDHSSVDPQQGWPASTLECRVTRGTHTLIRFLLIHCEELTHLPAWDVGSPCCTLLLHSSATQVFIWPYQKAYWGYTKEIKLPVISLFNKAVRSHCPPSP